MSFQPKQSASQRSQSPSPQEVSMKQQDKTQQPQPHILTRTDSQPRQQPRQQPHQQPRQQPRQQPQNYTIPSMESYSFHPCSHPIEEICVVTRQLTLLPEEFRTNMLKFICKEGLKGSSVYGEFHAPPNIEKVEIINGRGGYFLKKITLEANVYLIWYHRERGVYMFWGPTRKEVRDAKNRIRGRIAKYLLPTRDADLSLTEKMCRPQIADSPPPPPLERTMSYKHGYGEELPTYLPTSQEIQKNYQNSFNQKH